MNCGNSVLAFLEVQKFRNTRDEICNRDLYFRTTYRLRIYIKNAFLMCFPSILKNTLNPSFKLFFTMTQKHKKTAFLIDFRPKKFFLL